MTSQGDVRLIANVGVLLPTQGAQAVLLTSEPDGGSTPPDADMSSLRIDNVIIPASFTQLRIDYNFFTNEPAPSFANDRFVVDLVLVDSSGQETLLEIDTFSTLFPAPLTPFARQTGFRTLVADVSAHAGIGETVALELRLTDVGDGRLDSAVLVDNMQLTRVDEPEATANVEYLVIEPGVEFIFDGFASPDPDGDITEYQWDFGDGTGAFGPIAEHTYGAPGLYQATLTVTDRDGNRQTDTFLVAVGVVSASPSITSTAPLLVPQGGVYSYDVEAEDADIATGDALTYSLTQSPPGMTIDSQTGLIEWQPTLDSPRQAPVTVEVRDLLEQRDTQSFTIVVGAEDLVVAANNNGEVYAASSMGDGTFGPLAFVDKIGFGTGGVALADFDGDGDFDFVTGHAQNPEVFLYYFENEGAQFASPALLATVGDSTNPGGSLVRDLAAADVNADGLMDFAVNTDSPTTWLFQRDGALVFGQETFLNTDFEVDAGGWGTPTCGTDLALDNTTSNSGSQSMRVFATSNNSCLLVRIVPGTWNLFQGSALTFAYRVPLGTPVGLVVDVGVFGPLFLGDTPSASPGPRPVVSAVQLIDDNNWHTATINLAQAIRQQWPQASRIDHLEWRTESNAP